GILEAAPSPSRLTRVDSSTLCRSVHSHAPTRAKAHCTRPARRVNRARGSCAGTAVRDPCPRHWRLLAGIVTVAILTQLVSFATLLGRRERMPRWAGQCRTEDDCRRPLLRTRVAAEVAATPVLSVGEHRTMWTRIPSPAPTEVGKEARG